MSQDRPGRNSQAKMKATTTARCAGRAAKMKATIGIQANREITARMIIGVDLSGRGDSRSR